MIVIVGNKSDLETQRRVEVDEAENYAKKHKTRHYTVSAKNGSNINRLFGELGEEILICSKKNDEVLVGSKRIPRLMVEDPKEKDKKKKKRDCCEN